MLKEQWVQDSCGQQERPGSTVSWETEFWSSLISSASPRTAHTNLSFAFSSKIKINSAGPLCHYYSDSERY